MELCGQWSGPRGPNALPFTGRERVAFGYPFAP
jgi:hypothetical protein